MTYIPQISHFDSDQNAFFARELEHVYAATYDIRYPNLKARDFVPVSGAADPGATSVTYDQFDRTGRAKIISNNAKDIPRADVNGLQFNRPVREVAIGYGYTVKEIRSASMAGRNLNAMKAAAARRAVEEILDEVAAVGAPDYGITDGAINNAAVAVDTLGGGNDWATLAIAAGGPALIVAQVAAALSRIKDTSSGIFAANTVLVPEAQYMIASTTPFGDNSDKTILDFMMANFSSLQRFEPWYRLAGAGGAGADRMMVYDRSPDMLTQEIPSEFEQLPPQEQGLEIVINTMASTAGTAFYYPLSADYTDAI